MKKKNEKIQTNKQGYFWDFFFFFLTLSFPSFPFQLIARQPGGIILFSSNGEKLEQRKKKKKKKKEKEKEKEKKFLRSQQSNQIAMKNKNKKKRFFAAN